MIATMVWIVVVAGIATLLLWGLRELQATEPLNRVARVAIIIIAILIIIGLVATLFGVNTGLPRMTVQ